MLMTLITRLAVREASRLIGTILTGMGGEMVCEKDTLSM